MSTVREGAEHPHGPSGPGSLHGVGQSVHGPRGTGGGPAPQRDAHGESFRTFLDAVFRTHRESLVLFALRIVESRADAEDIVQDVFLRVLERGTDTPRADLSYLRQAVRNRALNRRRNQTSRWRGQHEWEHEQKTSGSRPHPPERAMERKRIAAVLRGGVAELTQGEREAWEWVCRRGAGHAQAAERLGVSPTAVKQRLWRARRRIREHLWSLGFMSMDELIGKEGSREFDAE